LGITFSSREARTPGKTKKKIMTKSSKMPDKYVAYRLEHISPCIQAVVIADKYDRAMTFCRVQEFYESPSSKFHGKAFSLWDYMKWYNQRYGKGFSYGHDWSGFNIPSAIAIQCMEKNSMGQINPQFETPYDQVMYQILEDISWKKGIYLIGTAKTSGSTFQHEICHGRYHTEPEYRKAMNAITDSLPSVLSRRLQERLQEMGYGRKVQKDEIQAYMQYGYDDESFLVAKEIKILEKQLKKPLKYYHLLYLKAAKLRHK
jgi:hypothetical protein